LKSENLELSKIVSESEILEKTEFLKNEDEKDFFDLENPSFDDSRKLSKKPKKQWSQIEDLIFQKHENLFSKKHQAFQILKQLSQNKAFPTLNKRYFLKMQKIFFN
jgi:hypothetical protein